MCVVIEVRNLQEIASTMTTEEMNFNLLWIYNHIS